SDNPRQPGFVTGPRQASKAESLPQSHRHRLELCKMSRNSEYTTWQPGTACPAASSWHTIGTAEVFRHDDARPYASAQELAQMEPGARVSGVCHLLHSRLSA